MSASSQARIGVAPATSAGAETSPGKPPGWFEGDWVRDSGVCWSLANLCLLRVWSELLTYTPGDTLLVKGVPGRGPYLAACGNALLLGAFIWVVLRRARRNRWAREFATVVFGALLLVVLNNVRILLVQHFETPATILTALTNGPHRWITAMAAAPMAVAALVLRHRVSRICSVGLLTLFPLALYNTARAIWRVSQGSSPAFADSAPAPFAAAPTPHRVIWILFDEWDQRQTFEDPLRRARLPELQRLRGQSLYASKAYSPGAATRISVLSLFTGKVLASAVPAGPAECLLREPGGVARKLTDYPDLFSKLRERGFNSAIFGSYLPYCRLFGNDTSLCGWWETHFNAHEIGHTWQDAMRNQLRSLGETGSQSVFGRPLVVTEREQAYVEMMEVAHKVVADPRISVLFLHFEIPHAPHFYDRHSRSMARGWRRSSYTDSLELVDRTIGELRRTLESAGYWDKVTLLVSSDHWNRQTAVEGETTDYRIPFLLKMAGQHGGHTITEPFNTVLSHELILSIVSGEIETPEQAKKWILSVRSGYPDPHYGSLKDY